VAALYLDNDVAQAVVALLQARGHAAVTARQLGLYQAADAVHLLTAAEHGWIFVTHNTKDYVMLHEAWLRWTAAWQVTAKHAGILSIPQSPLLPLDRAVDELCAFITSGRSLPNEMYRLPPADAWHRWQLGVGWQR
jgi:Domain of unknown function (DUF5615)